MSEGKIGHLYLFIISLCLVFGTVVCEEITILPPKPGPANVTITKDSLSFLEEVDPPFAILRVPKNGDAIPEAVVTSSSGNDPMGLDFKSDDSDWTLYVTVKQDYEVPSTSLGYTMKVKMGELDPKFISVSVVNADDNPPRVSTDSSTCSFPENWHGISDCVITIGDPDKMYEDFTIEIQENGAESENFGYNSTLDLTKHTLSLNLTVLHDLDYETKNIYPIDIVVQDNGYSPDYQALASLVIKVDDVADRPPVWSMTNPVYSIPEASPYTVQLKAYDGDIKVNASICFKLNLEEGQDYFHVDKTTGILTVDPIDRDIPGNDMFTFDAVAYECTPPRTENQTETSLSFIFIIEDIDDNSPKFNLLDGINVTLDEESSSLTLPEIFVTDPDAGRNGTFNVALEKDGKTDFTQAFSVVPSQGYQNSSFTVLVTNPTLLDYENEDWRHIQMKLVASAVDNDTEKDTLKLTIDLNNTNDESPVFSKQHYYVNVKEDIAENTYITTLKATDKDGDIIDKITYSTTSSSIINIDNVTGVVTAAKNNAFDYELQHEVIAQVMATDLANHVAYAQLTIEITDINDVAPTLHMPSSRIVLMEDTPVGYVIAECQISASDPDTDADLYFKIVYSTSSASKNGVPVDGDVFAGYFDVSEVSQCGQKGAPDSDATFAVLKLEKKLHWELFDSVSLDITVTDNNTLPEYPDRASRSATLTITIKDVNNNAPVVNITDSLKVPENSKVGQTIGNVEATDADYNTTLTYLLTSRDDLPGEWVKINDNGVLFVGSPDIDCDKYPNLLNYTVTVFDQVHNTSLDFQIEIEDLNDLSPVVQNKPPMEVTIPENTPSGRFFQIIATDGDRTAPFNEVSYLMDPLYANYWFAIDIDEGWISVNLTEGYVLDADTKDQYDIHISVRDNYNESSDYNTHATQAYVTLKLQDVNDNPPEFIEDAVTCQAQYPETIDNTAQLFSITAKDKDENVNFTTVDFKITSILPLDGANYPSDDQPSDPLFKIDTTPIDIGYKGVITAGRLLLGYVGKYNVTIEARNSLDVPENQHPVYRNYTICIQDVNDHSPVFDFPPNPGKSFRIYDTQELDKQMQYWDENSHQPTDLPPLKATDGDYGKNAEVTFDLTGSDYARQYFKIVSGGHNTGMIELKKPLDISSLEQRTFELQITATDGGDEPQNASTSLTFLVLTNEPNPPYFEVNHQSFPAYENEIKDFNFTAASDADNCFKPPELQTKIYYSIVGGNTTLFAIEDKEKTILSIVMGLDYEDRHNYSVLVKASDNDTELDTFDGSLGPNVLNITINVTDINDCPPSFTGKVFVGGIAATDNIGKLVLTVKADDPDTDDETTYAIMWETMHMNGTLHEYEKNGFTLNPKTGDLNLNFKPPALMSGFFTFDVNATDTKNHSDVAPVLVYVITDSNREQFSFLNTTEFVNEQRDTISHILTTILHYTCYITDIHPKEDSDGLPTNVTLVNTIFMDDSKHVPVDASVIEIGVNIFETKHTLREAFHQQGLNWDNYANASPAPTKSDEGFQQTILIAVSAVLAVLLFLLLAAFFFKTRRLNRRLDALSATKFGSLDSGLNRVNMHVPNTNQHALEGSNPVWNEQIDNDDNSSQGSGDSDLVGIEDSPEFKQHVDEKASSENGEYLGNQNFSFGAAKPSEPTTEL